MTARAHSLSDRDALQSRFALRIASALNERSVPHDIEQRLRVARDLAVARARARRVSVSVSAPARNVGMVGAHQAALTGGPDRTPWWVGSASAALVVALVVGLFAIDYRNTQVQIEAAAEVDALLLADDLPPKAYVDAGFREYLRSPQD